MKLFAKKTAPKKAPFVAIDKFSLKQVKGGNGDDESDTDEAARIGHTMIGHELTI